MKSEYIEDSVKTRLIIAGMNELEERGAKDFSLRRVALAAQVSCAAPYRHFKDKEDLILEIIRYIASKWELMCREIEAVFSSDSRALVIELAVANLRFWIANPNFRSVFIAIQSADGDSVGLDSFDSALMRAIDTYCKERSLPAEIKKYTVRALIYGSLMLVGKDNEKGSVADLLRQKLREEFP
jgi:AcrR family transcriptional regulator